MELFDDELEKFAADGAAPLPVTIEQGYVERQGARIWYGTCGTGLPVILLHGGLGHSGNWGYQVPALVASGYRAVLIDSRGHGRSSRNALPFSYELMASDVIAVMGELHLQKAGLVGWSDGACTALVLAARDPSRVAGVFYFACNMDPSGLKPIEATTALSRCFARHTKDYAQLSATPENFEELCRRRQPDGPDATELLRAGPCEDQRAGSDRAKRARRICQTRTRGISCSGYSGRGIHPAKRR